MYKRADFALALKDKIKKKQDVKEIGDWAYSVSLENDVDQGFHHILITLSYMELGPEFALSYERLNEIAEDMIAGREVNLDY